MSFSSFLFLLGSRCGDVLSLLCFFPSLSPSPVAAVEREEIPRLRVWGRPIGGSYRWRG
jgi:hypothetical protein